MEHEEKLCDEEEAIIELIYPGDRVNADGGCEVAFTA